MALSLDQQIACVKREIAFRTKVYRRFVRSGKMTEAEASYEIARMKDVLAKLERLRNDMAPQIALDQPGSARMADDGGCP